MVFIGRSTSIRSSRVTTPVSGLTCLRKRATVAREVTVRYPPLVMMSLLPSAISIGVGRPARTLQFLAAAGGTLRAPRDKVLGNDRTGQIEARNMIAQIGAKA